MVAALQRAQCWGFIAVARTLVRPLVDDDDDEDEDDDDNGDEQAMWPARRSSRERRVSLFREIVTRCD